MNQHSRTIACAIICLATASTSFAQGYHEREQPELAARCKSAVSNLKSGDIATRRSHLMTLLACDESGPPAIASLWQNPPAAAADLELLADVSRQFLDDRLFTQVESVSSDSRRSAIMRRVAVGTLLGYVLPNYAVKLSEPRGNSGRYEIRLVASSHGSARTTAFPVPIARLAAIPALLRRIALEDPDVSVKELAASAVQTLEVNGRH